MYIHTMYLTNILIKHIRSHFKQLFSNVKSLTFSFRKIFRELFNWFLIIRFFVSNEKILKQLCKSCWKICSLKYVSHETPNTDQIFPSLCAANLIHNLNIIPRIKLPIFVFFSQITWSNSNNNSSETIRS